MVGIADDPDFPGLDQIGVDAKRLFDLDGGILPVRQVEIDVFGLEALQRCLDGGLDIAVSASTVNTNGASFSIFYNTIPEPSTVTLLLLGIPGCVGRRRA